LVQLHRRYRDRVACISVSVDYSGLLDKPPEALRQQVLEILNAQHATLQNFLSATPDHVLYASLNLASVPAVFVYRPDGQLAKCFDNGSGEYGDEGFSYAKHVVPLVEQILTDASHAGSTEKEANAIDEHANHTGSH
jgi:hypothetical protein